MFLAVFLLCGMPILPSTPLWWCKVNQFPKGFPNLLLYYTGIQQTINLQCICLFVWQFRPEEVSRGGVWGVGYSNSPASLFFFPEDKNSRSHFQNTYGMFVTAKFHNFPFCYNCYDVPQHLMTEQNFFLPHVCLQMKCIDMVSLITWNSLFGRAAIWVVQGLRAPHSILHLCVLNHDSSKPHSFQVNINCPFDKLLLILILAGPPRQTLPPHFWGDLCRHCAFLVFNLIL